jgi:hypothetical protein
MAERALGAVSVMISFDGIPGGTVRMSADDLRAADPAGLIARLENRLHRLEDRKAQALADADRARREITHARETLGDPFPQTDQLTQARERARQIDEKLQQMAEADQQAEHAEATGPVADPESASPAVAPITRRSGHERAVSEHQVRQQVRETDYEAEP